MTTIKKSHAGNIKQVFISYVQIFPFSYFFNQKLPRIHLHIKIDGELEELFDKTRSKLNWSVWKRNPNEDIIKVQKENQKKIVVVISFPKFQKEGKDDQEKMISFNRPYRR